jgi:predicted small metal-binding protein
VAIGPVPLRTARGAGRLGFVRDRLPDDRAEEAAPFERGLGAAFEERLFRDAGGEDVRVAMVANVHRCLIRHLLHTPERSAGHGPPMWSETCTVRGEPRGRPMKRFRCGDVIPGCDQEFTGADDDDILRAVAEHAARNHDVPTLTPEMLAAVRAATVTT